MVQWVEQSIGASQGGVKPGLATYWVPGLSEPVVIPRSGRNKGAQEGRCWVWRSGECPVPDGSLGGCQAEAAQGCGRAPWYPSLLVLSLLQEQFTAQELISEQLLFGDREEEVLGVQASDSMVPDRAALPVVKADAVGIAETDHLDTGDRRLGERGWV